MNLFHKKVPIGLLLVTLTVPLLLLTGFCTNHQYSTKNMSPVESEFISETRYIMTKEEKKEFFRLTTDADRARFIEDFWAKRDPDLSTEDNEFKYTYYKRIDEANQKFGKRGKNGWLTDRGRIYILLGPPDTVRFYPGSVPSQVARKSIYHYPHIVWRYGFYPILFYDRLENGTFDLRPGTARNISTILNATLSLKPQVATEKLPYDFAIRLKKYDGDKMALGVEIPYKNILFMQEDDSDLFTVTLTVHLSIFDNKKKVVLKETKDYPVALKEEQLKDMEKSHRILIPFELEPGKYELETILESKADKLKTRKRIKFSI